MRGGFAFLCASLCVAQAAEPILRPPGFRPRAPGLQAIKAATVYADPTDKISPGTIIVRDGIIEAVGKDIDIPAGARVFNLTNRTVYAGFIDPAVTLRSTNSTRGVVASSTDFYGSNNRAVEHIGVESGRVTPQRRALEGYSPDTKELDAMRELGFAAGNILAEHGIFRGSGGVVLFNDENPNASVVKDGTMQFISFEHGGRAAGYPTSLMGVLALIRQTFYDARFHTVHPEDEYQPGLDALKDVLSGATPVLFDTRSTLMVDQATRIAAEFNLQFVQLASGQEWRRPELAERSKAAFIVPMNFPEIPKLPDDDDWIDISLDQLRAWDWAPENAAVLRKRGLEVALTTRGLSDKKNFRKNLRLMVDRGLSETDALASLTTIPAKLCGLDEKLGSIAPGKIANLTSVENEGLFQTTNKISEVWIYGELFRINLPEEKKVEEKKETKVADKEAKERDDKKAEERRQLMIKRLAKSAQEGRGPLFEPKAVMITNATVWTSGPEGKIEHATIVFADGKCQGIGQDVRIQGEVHIIDGTGKHVTPGLIDCHSHAALLDVNEGTVPSSAMVRMTDVVNSETRNIEEELAGGLTVANLLHGSANPIGGQNCVIKLRDGATPAELVFDAAPPGIKFALGENVKQSNWGEDTNKRFPQTRMGVPVFIRNRFLAARAYAEQMRTAPDKTKRDLELDAIVEILEGKRLIHCHSYRQDEILAFLRVCEEFGVRVASLQHVLEGYKVADEIAHHGAGGSTFSDWFNYKFEVIDAIPYNGAIMHDRGVVVSFNSDSSDLARRLYVEAAKAVKYGGLSEVEALKFVTINPAKQLHIEARVGSLERGKDADFAIWSKSPLDSGTMCLETWIDGKKYFDRAAIPRKTEALRKERDDLIVKAKQALGLKGGEKNEAAEAKFFEVAVEKRHEGHILHCDDE